MSWGSEFFTHRVGLGLIAVTHAGLGEQVAGTVRVIFELAAQPGHVEPQVIGALQEAGAPHAGQQLRRAAELARPLQQQFKYRPFSGCQAERLAGARGCLRGVRLGYLV